MPLLTKRSLEKFQVSKVSKEELQELQTSLDDLEQYTRKNSLEFRGIPEGINLSTDEIVYRVAKAIGIELQLED